jgi:hypothetical protein
MSMREPAEYGNDEVPIPVFYVLEIYQDTFRHERGEDTKRNLKHVGYLFSLVKARRKLLT